MASSRRSTSRIRSGSMPAIARGESAPMISAPDAGMGGRIVEDEARGVVLVEQGGAVFRRELLLLVRREGLGVLVGRNQVVVAGQEIRAVRQPLDRLGLTQRAIGRVGVGIELRRQLFEVEGGRQFARIQIHGPPYSLGRLSKRPSKLVAFATILDAVAQSAIKGVKPERRLPSPATVSIGARGLRPVAGDRMCRKGERRISGKPCSNKADESCVFDATPRQNSLGALQ